MNSARRNRSSSRPRDLLRARSQPAIPRSWEEVPVLPSTTHARNYSTAARDVPPGAFFNGSSQLWEPDSRLTPPPAAAMRAADSTGSGRGAKAAPSATPAEGKSKRVRTGCLTCRERHLKCDEGVPECNNCRKSNRECRRGIRLNFIDIQVKDPPCLPPTADWSVQILDESRSIASEYQGGLGRYPSVVASPSETDSDAGGFQQIGHPDPKATSTFVAEINSSRDPSGLRDLYHPNHADHPPPSAPAAYAERAPSRMASIDGLSVAARAATGSPSGFAAPGQEPISRPLNIRSREGHGDSSPFTQNLHLSGSVSASQHFGTPSGLMTPSSENTTGERDYLSTDEEILFMQAFVDGVAIWMDALDKDKHFANVVPYLALKLPMLLNALLACGARYLTLVGEHDGERASYYYGIASAQLSRSQLERDRDITECTLTAAVLNAYDVMSDKPSQRIGHIASTRALVRECGWDASSTGLGAACFWLNVGMEVLSCISFGWPTAWDPDQWGLDLEFATLGAASRSGSRSVAGSDDAWGGRAGSQRPQPVMDDTPELGNEELWVHRIFYILAKVANFRATTPKFQEPSPHDEQVRLQNRFAEWRRLQNMCNAWNLHCPRSMRPYGYSPGPSPKSLFPNVWLIKPPAKLARLFYHTAMCLLVQTNPLEPPDQNRQQLLHHAHHVCGIVAHAHHSTRDDRGVVSVAIRSLAVVGAALVDRAEQDELLDVLGRIGRESGWRLGRVVEELRRAWGRDGAPGGGGGAGLSMTSAAGMGVLAPLPAAPPLPGGMAAGSGGLWSWAGGGRAGEGC